MSCGPSFHELRAWIPDPQLIRAAWIQARQEIPSHVLLGRKEEQAEEEKEEEEEARRVSYKRSRPVKALTLEAQEKQGYRANAAVRIVGLQNAAHLNGCRGRLQYHVSEFGRWQVALEDGPEAGQSKVVKPDNIEPLDAPKRLALTQKSFKVGDRAEIRGLETRPELNGRTCLLLAAEDRRWKVMLEGTSEEKLMKPKHLHPIEESIGGLGSSSLGSPWKWPLEQSGKNSLLSVDQTSWADRLATEEMRREGAEARASELKEDLHAVSERLAFLEAQVGASLGPTAFRQVASPIPMALADDELAGGSLMLAGSLSPNEQNRLEWAEARVVALERQLAEATHMSRTLSDSGGSYGQSASRRGLDGQVDTSLDVYVEPDGSRPAGADLQVADRVAAQRLAMLPWKEAVTPDRSLADSQRSFYAAVVESLRKEVAEFRRHAEQEAGAASEERALLLARAGAETGRADHEAAEASLCQQRLSHNEAAAVKRVRRAVQDEGRAIQGRLEAATKALRRELEVCEEAKEALWEELAVESGMRARDLGELTALRERLAGSELDATAQRALLEERSSLQQQLALIVKATRQRMEASRDDRFALHSQLAAQEDRSLEEASEVVALRRRLAASELDAEHAAAAAREGERQLTLERASASAKAASHEQRLLAAEQDCGSLRERLSAEVAAGVAAASRAVAVESQLAGVEQGAEQALQRAVLAEANAARQGSRWTALVAQVLHSWVASGMQAGLRHCAAKSRAARSRLEAELGTQSRVVDDLARRLDGAERSSQQAEAAAEQHSGQLAVAEGRISMERAAVEALQQRLVDAEQDAERSLCRAVQAESAKLHKRFTPIVEKGQLHLEESRAEAAALRSEFEDERARRMRVVLIDKPRGLVEVDLMRRATKGVEQVKSPEPQVSEAQAPEAKAPDAKAPEAEAPEAKAKALEAKAPEAEAPEAKAPEAKALEAEAPEAEAPEEKALEAKAPEAKAPEGKALEAKAPEGKALEAKAPESKGKAPEAKASALERKGGAPEAKLASLGARAPGPQGARQSRCLRPKALLLGDSITEESFYDDWSARRAVGWVSLLQHHLKRKVDVLNYGYSGYNTRQARAILPRILEDPVFDEPLFFAVVMFGANDASLPGTFQHVPVEEYKENLAAIVKALQDRGCQRIILLSPTPVVKSKWPDRTNHDMKRYAQAVMEMAPPEGSGVLYRNLYNHMRSLPDYPTLMNDGLHLNERGHRELWGRLREVLPEPPRNDFPGNEELTGKDYMEVREQASWHPRLRGLAELAAQRPRQEPPALGKGPPQPAAEPAALVEGARQGVRGAPKA